VPLVSELRDVSVSKVIEYDGNPFLSDPTADDLLQQQQQPQQQPAGSSSGSLSGQRLARDPHVHLAADGRRGSAYELLTDSTR